ncbi:MAG: tetratricopeptide repeat protein [Anaerolineae bacterium]
MKSFKRSLGKGWPILLAGGLLAALAFPHLASAYHLEAGGRALDGVDRLGDSALPALEHLLQAVDWHAGNAQAYRLLARVYQAQGDWAAAVEALTRYTELRPDNPLGHVELAHLYEAVEAEIRSMDVVDLIAALPEASVEAPNIPLDTPFAQADGPAWRSYVAATAFSLPPAAAGRPTLFMHPPARVIYTLSLPAQPAVLRFGLGLDPQSHDWPGDGATFEVFLGGERIFLEHVDKAMALEGWHERMVDLGPWAGEEITLALAVTPGPAGDASGDWAGWGEPQVVDPRMASLQKLQPGTRAREEWKRARLMAGTAISEGQRESKAGQYDQAEQWFQRAVLIEPGLGDAWYFLGQLYEDQEQWSLALEAYERAAASGIFKEVGRSSTHYRVGMILQRYLQPPRLEDALAAYGEAIEIDDFSASWEAAACHYQRGETLWRIGGDLDESIAEFRQAIELNPEHAWAQIRLAVAVYERDQDAVLAESLLLRAIELDPQNKWALLHLGDVYHEEGRCEAADLAYRRALEIDPAFEPAQNRRQLGCQEHGR